MSEYDLTGSFPEFSDEEIEAFNRNSRDIEIEAGSLALAQRFVRSSDYFTY